MAKKIRHYDRQASEKKLIKAAEEVFAKEGFKGATTREIAKKAGLNLANIAHYFGDKHGLLMRIVQEEITSFQEKELVYPKQASVSDELLKYSLSHYEDLLAKTSMIKIIMGQFITDAKFIKKFHETMPIIIGNRQLEARLQNLVKEKKMTDQYPIPTIIEDVENQIFMLVLSMVIIKLQPVDKVREKLEMFIQRYCKALEIFL